MSNADAIIAALRSGSDTLAGLVPKLTDDELARQSGAAEWDISQVLSHLGSSAEINQAIIQAALDGKPAPSRDFNQPVWDRWNAMGRRERADQFLRANATLTGLFESLAARDDLRIDTGFLPAPIDVATAARFRLTELALHSWDVHVGFDERATLAQDATDVLAGWIGDLARMTGKPEPLAGQRAVIRVEATGPDLTRALRLGDRISVDADIPAQPDGTLDLPAESWVRLVTGRLRPEHTPAAVTATGPADLNLLRRVFPGF